MGEILYILAGYNRGNCLLDDVRAMDDLPLDWNTDLFDYWMFECIRKNLLETREKT